MAEPEPQFSPVDRAKVLAGADIAFGLVASMRKADFNPFEIAQSLVSVAIDVMVTGHGFETARVYFADVAISIDADHPLSTYSPN